MQNLTPYFDFPPPHCLFTMILLGGSEEDLQVFTGETANAKAKWSENFLSPDQNWPNFGGFQGLGSGGTKCFNFYSKRHILARICVVEAILRDNRLRGLTTRGLREKKAESHRTSHRKHVLPLTQACTLVQLWLMCLITYIHFSWMQELLVLYTRFAK